MSPSRAERESESERPRALRASLSACLPSSCRRSLRVATSTLEASAPLSVRHSRSALTTPAANVQAQHANASTNTPHHTSGHLRRGTACRCKPFPHRCRDRVHLGSHRSTCRVHNQLILVGITRPTDRGRLIESQVEHSRAGDSSRQLRDQCAFVNSARHRPRVREPRC